MTKVTVTRRIVAGAVAATLALSLANSASAERSAHSGSMGRANGYTRADEVTVIVRLRDQASLTTASRQRTRPERQRAVVRALRDTATRAQGPVRRVLDDHRAHGRVRSYTPLWAVDALVVTATPDVIAELAARPDVASVSSDAIAVVPAGFPVAPPEPHITQIDVPALWSLGFDGAGVTVASLDTGVDASHPDLAANFRGGTNSWFDPFGQHPATPFDASGHGTATMGLIAGGGTGGTTVGVAPGSTWIAARIFDDAGNSTASAIHQAMQWVLDPDGDPATADAPSIVNNSWTFATPGCNLEFQADLQALRAAGIAPVFAAGNYGSGASTSASPANYPEAISVGAVDSRRRIWSGSSRGPTTCGGPSRTYPDVVAPGVNSYSTDRYGLYSYWTGTSMAAPEVSGALAVMLSSQQATEPASEAALLSTAVDIGAAGPDNVFGRGLVDVAAAYATLAEPPPTTTTTTTTEPTTTTTEPTTTTTQPTTTTTQPTTTTTEPTTTTTQPTTTTTQPTTTTTQPTTTTTQPTTTTTQPTTTTTQPTTTTTQPTTTTLPPTTTTLPPTTTTLPPTPADLLFADGFESGGVGAWSSAATNGGRLAAVSSAALDGSYGLRADISNRSDMYVLDTSPSAATTSHARFRFDPNSVTVSNGKVHTLFGATSTSGARIVDLQFRKSSGVYQIRAGTRLDSGSVKYSGWVTISDAPHVIEVGWTASAPASSRNGTLSLWIDGGSVSTLTKLANGAQRIESAQLGPQGIPSGVSGVEYFDSFVSTVNSYIGN